MYGRGGGGGGYLACHKKLGVEVALEVRAALIGMPDEAEGLAGDMTALGISAPGHGLLGADRRENVRLNMEPTYMN